MLRKAIVLALAISLFMSLNLVMAQDEAETVVEETAVQFIDLTGTGTDPDAEVSSLVWYNDTLLLITENPFIYAEDGDVGAFFALEKEDILDYLASDGAEALEPYRVPLLGEDILDAVGGFAVAFDGFEAAAITTQLGLFVDDRIYLTIEADTVSASDPSMRSYVVSGAIAPDLSSITLDLNNFVEIPVQSDFNNMSYESLFVMDGQLMAIYEANIESVVEDNVAYAINLSTGELSEVPMPALPYRITDTTSVDENGVFYAINYFFPGEGFLGTDEDAFFAEFGRGETQTIYGQGINGDNPEWGFVERILAFQVSDSGIELTGDAPINIQMTDDSNGRNWEGIVRLDDMGFLIVVDKYPSTLLGFVPAE